MSILVFKSGFQKKMEQGAGRSTQWVLDMGWPDLLSKLAVMVMMMIDNLVSPMISPR
jgi:hypothetical protein